jgi:predicted Zn-dependent peptidase
MRRALFMFCDILGGHGMSLLMQELREKRGLVYGVWSSIETVARRDIFKIFIRGQAQKIGEISAITIDTLRNAAFGLPEAEVAAARRRYHVGHGMQHDIQPSRVEDMATDMVEMGRVTNVAERYGHYQAMTRVDLEGAAQAMLALEPALVLQAPMRGEPKFADIRARLAGAMPLSKAV